MIIKKYVLVFISLVLVNSMYGLTESEVGKLSTEQLKKRQQELARQTAPMHKNNAASVKAKESHFEESLASRIDDAIDGAIVNAAKEALIVQRELRRRKSL